MLLHPWHHRLSGALSWAESSLPSPSRERLQRAARVGRTQRAARGPSAASVIAVWNERDDDVRLRVDSPVPDCASRCCIPVLVLLDSFPTRGFRHEPISFEEYETAWHHDRCVVLTHYCRMSLEREADLGTPHAHKPLSIRVHLPCPMSPAQR